MGLVNNPSETGVHFACELERGLKMVVGVLWVCLCQDRPPKVTPCRHCFLLQRDKTTFRLIRSPPLHYQEENFTQTSRTFLRNEDGERNVLGGYPGRVRPTVGVDRQGPSESEARQGSDTTDGQPQTKSLHQYTSDNKISFHPFDSYSWYRQVS